MPRRKAKKLQNSAPCLRIPTVGRIHRNDRTRVGREGGRGLRFRVTFGSFVPHLTCLPAVPCPARPSRHRACSDERRLQKEFQPLAGPALVPVQHQSSPRLSCHLDSLFEPRWANAVTVEQSSQPMDPEVRDMIVLFFLFVYGLRCPLVSHPSSGPPPFLPPSPLLPLLAPCLTPDWIRLGDFEPRPQNPFAWAPRGHAAHARTLERAHKSVLVYQTTSEFR